ncbi:MAG: F0F1 ATP synthase subunit alpha [Planctomycetes bacterium GWF2_41_51]|nr:MAG: F0F1 ATP synthase subunit alpha [Planctomycetes bacterium GWF2_41_51]
MKLDISELSNILKQEISQYKNKLDVTAVGRVVEVGDGIARIYGLQNAMAGEMLMFEHGIKGEVFNLEEDSIGAVIYGDFIKIREGSDVHSTGQLLSVPVGTELLGRVVNPLCEAIDGGPEIKTASTRYVEFDAPAIAQRQPVKKPLQTGIKSIDSMIPIGRGQRELIIGDRKTGKTAIAIDTILNQQNQNVICIYVAIGQKESTVAEVIEILRKNGAMSYTIVITSPASDSASMQYIAPYAGCALAEYFMYEHKRDVLCVYDDLSKHAVAYRQLSLLLRRPPGREAYPGDIFYLHSRLLERSAKLSEKLGSGSMTALPIVETLEEQVSAYIPTNVISITDGQIYLKRDLFLSGIRPAVDVGTSVSRVGGNAQVSAMKKVASKLRLNLASYNELLNFARLGTELDSAAQSQLDRGARMVELLKQPQFSPLNVGEQVITIFIGLSGIVDDIDVKNVAKFAQSFIQRLKSEHGDFIDEINTTGNFSDELAAKITEEIKIFKEANKITG